MAVFEHKELMDAMKLYLPKMLKSIESTFSEQEAQEWSGMCLRKSALHNILQDLQEEKFLIKTENGRMKFNGAIPNFDEDAELFSNEIIVNRMFTYLIQRFANDDAPTWSEGDMQDWDGMVLRKRVILDCMDDLVEEMKIVRCGLFKYKLLN
jgi:hypothetical protein